MTEIRLAEDQMQRLLDAIHGVHVQLEPAPASMPKVPPHTHKPVVYGPGEHGYLGEPKPEPEPTAKQILADLWRDYNEAKEELLKAKQEIERLKSCVKDSDKNATYWRQQVEGVTEGEDNDKLRQEIERLKAQVPKERACVTLGPYGENYELFMAPIIFGDRESATKWAEERGLEVVE